MHPGGDIKFGSLMDYNPPHFVGGISFDLAGLGLPGGLPGGNARGNEDTNGFQVDWDGGEVKRVDIDATRLAHQAERCAEQCPPRTREVIVGYEDAVNGQSVVGPPPEEIFPENACREESIRLITQTVPDRSCETACYMDNIGIPAMGAMAALLGKAPLTISAQFPVEKATVDVRFTAEEDFTGFRIGLKF